MPMFFGVIAFAVLTFVTVTVFGIWGMPFSLIIGAILIAYVLSARKSGQPVATVERGRRQEPTGMPRKASSGAETANERVGQS